MNAMVNLSEYKSALLSKTIPKVYNDIGHDYNSADEFAPEMDDCMMEAYKLGCVVNNSVKVRRIIHRSPIRIRKNKSPGRHLSRERSRDGSVKGSPTRGKDSKSNLVMTHTYNGGVSTDTGIALNSDDSTANLSN